MCRIPHPPAQLICLQRSFADGLIAEEVADLWELWTRLADQMLEDDVLFTVIQQEVAWRFPRSSTSCSWSGSLFPSEIACSESGLCFVSAEALDVIIAIQFLIRYLEPKIMEAIRNGSCYSAPRRIET